MQFTNKAIRSFMQAFEHVCLLLYCTMCMLTVVYVCFAIGAAIIIVGILLIAYFVIRHRSAADF